MKDECLPERDTRYEQRNTRFTLYMYVLLFLQENDRHS